MALRAASPADGVKLSDAWDTVKQCLDIYLHGRVPTDHEQVNARVAAKRMETATSASSSQRVYYQRLDGTYVHGVRVRVVKMIRAHSEAQSDKSDQVFSQHWQAACDALFTHHDRHYVEERRKEPRSSSSVLPSDVVFPDDGTMSMYELGMAVWRENRTSDVATALQLLPPPDDRWHTIETYLTSSLDGDQPSGVEGMRAYSCVYELSTSGDKQAGDVRKRVIGFMSAYYRRVPQQDRSIVAERWQKACDKALVYHDRHRVKRMREENPSYAKRRGVGLWLKDDGTRTMFELGMAVWDEEHAKDSSRFEVSR